MSDTVDLSGFEKLESKLSELDGSRVVFDDLFPTTFMKRYTDFTSIQAMGEAWGKEIPESANFGECYDEDWETLVQQNTRFKNWEEMKSQAAAEYAKKELGF